MAKARRKSNEEIEARFDGVFCRFERIAATQSISPSVDTTVDFDNEDLNNGGFINTSGDITIPEEGVYEVTASVAFDDSSGNLDSGEGLRIDVWKNTNVKRITLSYLRLTASAASNTILLSGKALISFSQGDSVVINVRSGAGTGNVDIINEISSGIQATYVEIKKIGEL